MDVLFSTLLFVNGRSTLYSVTFHDEQYHFTPEDKDGGDEFILVREHDEWHDQESLPPEIKKQAIDALENYFLQQH